MMKRYRLPAWLFAASLLVIASRDAVYAADANVVVSTGIDTSLAGQVIVAQELGYFKEARLSVENIRFSSGSAATEALATQEAEFAVVGDTPAITMVASGLPVKAVSRAADITEFTQLVVASDHDVKKPSDLEGLTLAYTAGSVSDFFLKSLVDAYGLDESKIEFLNLSPPEALAAYKAGEVDGCMLWEPWPFRFDQARSADRLHTGTTSYFPSNRGEKVQLGALHTVVLVHSNFENANSDLVQNFLNAMFKATDFIVDPANKEEVIKMWAKGMEQDKAEVRQQYELGKWTMSVTQRFFDDLDATMDALENSGRISRQPDPRKWFDVSYLKNLDAELVKLK